MKTKGLLTSLTAWSDFATLGSAIAVIQEVEPHIAAVVAGVSAIVGIFGRLRASTKIKGLF
jgi:hypothetical protein